MIALMTEVQIFLGQSSQIFTGFEGSSKSGGKHHATNAGMGHCATCHPKALICSIAEIGKGSSCNFRQWPSLWSLEPAKGSEQESPGGNLAHAEDVEEISDCSEKGSKDTVFPMDVTLGGSMEVRRLSGVTVHKTEQPCTVEPFWFQDGSQLGCEKSGAIRL